MFGQASDQLALQPAIELVAVQNSFKLELNTPDFKSTLNPLSNFEVRRLDFESGMEMIFDFDTLFIQE